MICKEYFSPVEFKKRDKESRTCIMIMDDIIMLKNCMDRSKKGMKKCFKVLAAGNSNIDKAYILKIRIPVHFIEIRSPSVYSNPVILRLIQYANTTPYNESLFPPVFPGNPWCLLRQFSFSKTYFIHAFVLRIN